MKRTFNLKIEDLAYQELLNNLDAEITFGGSFALEVNGKKGSGLVVLREDVKEIVGETVTFKRQEVTLSGKIVKESPNRLLAFIE